MTRKQIENYLENDCAFRDYEFRKITEWARVSVPGSINLKNGDAPYFRVEHLTDVYEGQFEARTLEGIKRAASKHVKGLLKVVGAK